MSGCNSCQRRHSSHSTDDSRTPTKEKECQPALSSHQVVHIVGVPGIEAPSNKSKRYQRGAGRSRFVFDHWKNHASLFRLPCSGTRTNLNCKYSIRSLASTRSDLVIHRRSCCNTRIIAA